MSDTETVESYPVLALPADGVPKVVDTPAALADARAALRSGQGPLAIDTERAQGYRYTRPVPAAHGGIPVAEVLA